MYLRNAVLLVSLYTTCLPSVWAAEPRPAAQPKQALRTFVVPVGKIPTSGNWHFTEMPYKAKVVLGPEVKFANMTLAPDVENVSVSGVDLQAQREPLTIGEDAKVETEGKGWHVTTATIKTKLVGSIEIILERNGAVSRVLLTPQQLVKLRLAGH